MSNQLVRISASDAILDTRQTTSISLAKLVDMEEHDYHARPEISHSKLELFRKNRRQFYRRYVSMEQAEQIDTAAMAQGRAFHRAILEPDRFADLYAVARENWDLRTKPGKAAHEAFQQANPGKLVIRLQDWDGLDDAIEAAFANPDLERIIKAPGLCEKSVFWELSRHHGITSGVRIPMRSRMDKVCFLSCGEFVFPDEAGIEESDTVLKIDLKLMASGEAKRFAWDAVEYGYHRQSAVYKEALRQCFPGKKIESYYGVVAKDKPRAYLYKFNDHFVESGWKESVADADQLASAVCTDYWGFRSGGVAEIYDPRKS